MAEGFNTPEIMQAVQAGAVEGGVIEATRLGIGKLAEAARKIITDKLSLSKAEAEVKGIEGASDRVANKGIKAIVKIGETFGKAADHLNAAAERREKAAGEHEKRLLEIRNARANDERKAKEDEMALMSRDMLNLNLELKKVGMLEGLKKRAENKVAGLKESWHDWRRSADIAKAAGEKAVADKLDQACQTIKLVEDRLEEIFSDSSALETARHSVETATSTLDQDQMTEQEIQDRLDSIMHAGPVAKSAVTEVMAKPVEDVAGQREEVARHQNVVANLGASNNGVNDNNF